MWSSKTSHPGKYKFWAFLWNEVHRKLLFFSFFEQPLLKVSLLNQFHQSIAHFDTFVKSCFRILSITGSQWFFKQADCGGKCVSVGQYPCIQSEPGLLSIIEHLPLRVLKDPYCRQRGTLTQRCLAWETKMNYFC